jgi:hypothetical protein
MLNIIDNFRNTPNPFLAAKDISFVEPGIIGQLAVQDGIVVCTTSDGKAPLGVIDSLSGKNLLLWLTRFLGQTDQFDKDFKYPINSILYVSEKGLLTPRSSVDEMGIAICTGIGDYLEFLWL